MFNRGNNGGIGSSGENTGSFAGTSSVETGPRTRSDTSEYRNQNSSVNKNINTSAGGLQQGLQANQQVDLYLTLICLLKRKFI